MQSALLGYVPIKVNVDVGGGRVVASRYRVNGLPTFLLLNGDGELVGRFDGYLPADDVPREARPLLRGPRLNVPGDLAAHPLFVRGAAEFRAGRFFEAHEEWETLWKDSAGDDRLLLQALIQIAAACVHLTRGNAAPGVRLLALAEEKLGAIRRRLRGRQAGFS